jgi:hypothetical protein
MWSGWAVHVQCAVSGVADYSTRLALQARISLHDDDRQPRCRGNERATGPRGTSQPGPSRHRRKKDPGSEQLRVCDSPLLGSVAARPEFDYTVAPPTRRRVTRERQLMKIVPTSIEKQISRVDRQRSLAIAISCGLVAFWSIYRVIWSLYLALTYDFLFSSLVVQIVLWGIIGAIAGIAAFGFFNRYQAASSVDAPKPANPEQL